MRKGLLSLILLLVICFALIAWLQPRYEARINRDRPAGSLLADLLGDGRKLAADYFYVQADVYFHSGYYPSVFDRARQEEVEESAVSHPEAEHGGEQGHEEKGFMGEPLDWIDRLRRHFRPSVHTHLYGAQLREILPWMKLSAELDPHRVQTYSVTAYWLREKLHRPYEAEDFLREGLKQNPHSPELLYSLGEVYLENLHDYPRARNTFLAAWRCWNEVEGPKPEKTKTGEGQRNDLLLEQILGALVQTEEASGHYEKAIEYMELVKKNSPNPAEVQKRIDALKLKLSDETMKTIQPFHFWQNVLSGSNNVPSMKR
jgi:tetratricopeptide (TPR) repeat protein